MATYLQGVTDYIPQVQPWTPDLGFYANVLTNKEQAYEANWSKLNTMYNNVLNAPMLREENIQRRDQFFKQAQEEIKKLSGVDLSLQENVDTAESLFEPFYNNEYIVKDIAFTTQYQRELNRAEALHRTTDPDLAEKYWTGGVRLLNYKAEEFANSSDDESLNFRLPKYVDAVNIPKLANQIFKESGISAEVDIKDSGYIKTIKNGETIVAPVRELLTTQLMNRPDVNEYLRAEAELLLIENPDQANAQYKAMMKLYNKKVSEGDNTPITQKEVDNTTKEVILTDEYNNAKTKVRENQVLTRNKLKAFVEERSRLERKWEQGEILPNSYEEKALLESINKEGVTEQADQIISKNGELIRNADDNMLKGNLLASKEQMINVIATARSLDYVNTLTTQLAYKDYKVSLKADQYALAEFKNKLELDRMEKQQEYDLAKQNNKFANDVLLEAFKKGEIDYDELNGKGKKDKTPRDSYGRPLTFEGQIITNANYINSQEIPEKLDLSAEENAKYVGHLFNKETQILENNISTSLVFSQNAKGTYVKNTIDNIVENIKSTDIAKDENLAFLAKNIFTPIHANLHKIFGKKVNEITYDEYSKAKEQYKQLPDLTRDQFNDLKNTPSLVNDNVQFNPQSFKNSFLDTDYLVSLVPGGVQTLDSLITYGIDPSSVTYDKNGIPMYSINNLEGDELYQYNSSLPESIKLAKAENYSFKVQSKMFEDYAKNKYTKANAAAKSTLTQLAKNKTTGDNQENAVNNLLIDNIVNFKTPLPTLRENKTDALESVLANYDKAKDYSDLQMSNDAKLPNVYGSTLPEYANEYLQKGISEVNPDAMFNMILLSNVHEDENVLNVLNHIDKKYIDDAIETFKKDSLEKLYVRNPDEEIYANIDQNPYATTGESIPSLELQTKAVLYKLKKNGVKPVYNNGKISFIGKNNKEMLTLNPNELEVIEEVEDISDEIFKMHPSVLLEYNKLYSNQPSLLGESGTFDNGLQQVGGLDFTNSAYVANALSPKIEDHKNILQEAVSFYRQTNQNNITNNDEVLLGLVERAITEGSKDAVFSVKQVPFNDGVNPNIDSTHIEITVDKTYLQKLGYNKETKGGEVKNYLDNTISFNIPSTINNQINGIGPAKQIFRTGVSSILSDLPVGKTYKIPSDIGEVMIHKIGKNSYKVVANTPVYDPATGEKSTTILSENLTGDNIDFTNVVSNVFNILQESYYRNIALKNEYTSKLKQ